MSQYCYYCMSKKAGDVCSVCGRHAEADVGVHHLLPGTVLENRYLIGYAIGEGGFGITYIGKDLKLDMVVAVKEYYPNGFVNRNNTADNRITITSREKAEYVENGKKQFIREARILAKFSGNQSIVDVRDHFECNNTAYIVMEYIQGITLSTYIKTNGNFAATDLIKRMLPLFRALKLIHKNGLIHRDISPDNIMILPNGSLKLMDFGAAREVNFDDKKSLSIVLRPGYAPEEQYRSKGEQGPWTDIYAACATIYKCITGITPDESTERVYADELQPPSRCGVDIPLRYEQALMKGLAVYQKDRYQSVDELIEAFSVTGNEDVPAVNIIDLSDASDSDDKTEYYEEPEESNGKAESDSDDELKGTVDNPGDSEDNDDEPDKKKKLKKLLKRTALISIPAVLIIIGLMVVLIIVPSNKSNESSEPAKKETSSQHSDSSQTENIVTTTAQETAGAVETTYIPKTYTITNDAELGAAYGQAQAGDEFSISNVLLHTDGTNYSLSYSGTEYPILSETIDLSKYKDKNVSVTGTGKIVDNMFFLNAESVISNSANSIVINDVSSSEILPILNPTVSYNGYKDLFEGIVISGEINVTEYFTQSDIEHWGYNIQLYKTDVSETESDNDMFTQLEGPAKNIHLDSNWASIYAKAFAVKIPDDIEPGEYTIFFQQYGDSVGLESFIKFTAKK